MKKGKESFLLAGVVAASLAVALIVNFSSAPVAAAQEEKPKQETAREEKVRGEYELGTMTVTSQKREENVQDVPMSISVFSDIQLEDAGIKDISDLVRFAPNVYMKQIVPDNIIVIRGMTGFNPSLFSPAGFYVDDVNFPILYMHNPDLFDIERVEILKGPQGTLYGRNSESGVINIITKQPDNELRGKIFGEYKNRAHKRQRHLAMDSYRQMGHFIYWRCYGCRSWQGLL
jgi:iron complex outermembrane receptor protein